MRKKGLCLCTVIVASMLFAACTKASTSDTKDTMQVNGLIQSVDDSVITISVMDFPQGEKTGEEQRKEFPGGEPMMPGDEGTEFPSSGQMIPGDGETEIPSDGEIIWEGEIEGEELPNDGQMIPEEGQMMPGGRNPMQEGELPEFPNGDMQMFGGDNTVSYSITDSTKILDSSGNTITIDALTPFSMVTVQYDEANNATVITVFEMDFRKNDDGMRKDQSMNFGTESE